MKIERLAFARKQATTIAQGAADAGAALFALLGAGSVQYTVRGNKRTHTHSGPGKGFYSFKVTLDESELRDGLAQLHSLRLAHEDGGAPMAFQRAGNGKRWEKPIVRPLTTRTIFSRLEKAGQRRRAKRKATEGSND